MSGAQNASLIIPGNLFTKAQYSNSQLWVSNIHWETPIEFYVLPHSTHSTSSWKYWLEGYDVNNNRVYYIDLWLAINDWRVMYKNSIDIDHITLGISTDITDVTPDDLTSVEIVSLPRHNWYINESCPDNDWFVPRPAVLEDQPYPIWAFKQDDAINRGYPYNLLVPDKEIININPVRQRDYICVYDMLSQKIDFRTNGLAILNPTEATIHEVLNGEYSLTLTHPIDALGKWRYIRESNIIKCQGQLFTIKRVEWNHSTKKLGSVTAYCEHIFYQLNDMWIFADDQEDFPTYAYCISAMDGIMRRCVTLDEPGMYRFDYEWDSTWEWGNSGWQLVIEGKGDGKGQTPVEKFLGSGGIIDQKGGELYRNNFYFSINETMENADDNAFDLRFGGNLTGIKRTIDTSTLALWFGLRDEETKCFGAISWDGRAFPLMQFPHNIVRSDSIRYEDDYYEAVRRGEVNIFDRLMPDVYAVWKKTATPILCYELSVVDMIEEHPELTNHYKFKVGNSGNVYDELLLGRVKLKITETEVDGITGKVKSIVIGSKNSFTRGSGYPLNPDYGQPTTYTWDFQLHDSNQLLLFDCDGKALYRRGTY